ncbi:hypothetical protein [Novipirellula artificiosorum]|uniref:Phytase-like domain-containing protein n=1 Tax=Novipirellula artificiosorum TaxID=2528016 RepID=A0A5C6DDN9_9BACT|nr:hypothetical protein [Novipirellula artificiosorum]TWU33897.1 hypothetical protein Poly41_48970 [Novipirellula artificiosorum]
MKRLLQVPLQAFGAILLVMFTVSLAYGQATVQYRLEQVPIPEGFFVNDFNNQNLVVGHSRYTDGETVVLYDHDGVLGAPRSTWSLDDLIDVSDEFSSASILDINESGQFVAYLKRDDGTDESILVDLYDTGGSLSPTWRYLNVPASSGLSYAKRINDLGEVLGQFVDDVSGDTHAFLLDSTNPSSTPVVLTDPTTGMPIAIRAPDLLRLNNLGQVSGNTYIETDFGYGISFGGFRLTPSVEMLLTPLSETLRTATIRDMNDFGEMTGEALVAVTGSGRKGKTTTSLRGIRFDETGYEFLPPAVPVRGRDINNAGDVLGSIDTTDGSREAQFLVHDSNLIYLDDVVTGVPGDEDFWHAATDFYHQHMNDRDATGYGHVFARAGVVVTTGKGRNQTTTSETRYFILTPELP